MRISSSMNLNYKWDGSCGIVNFLTCVAWGQEMVLNARKINGE